MEYMRAMCVTGGKLVRDVAAHALRIRRGGYQIGVCRLDFLKFDKHLIERGVGNLRGIEHVVAVRMVVQLVTELRRTRRSLFMRQRRLRRFRTRRIAKQVHLFRHRISPRIPSCVKKTTGLFCHTLHAPAQHRMPPTLHFCRCDKINLSFCCHIDTDGSDR